MNEVFNSLFEKAEPIAFNTAWCAPNRTLNNAVIGDDAPKLKLGQIAATKDNHGRKIVILTTPNNSNVVLYQRFVNSPNGVICSNETFEFSELVKKTTGVDITLNINNLQIDAICKTILNKE